MKWRKDSTPWKLTLISDHDCEAEKKFRENDMIKSLEPIAIRDMYGNLRREEFACPYCEIVFDSKKEFTEHVVLHAEGYPCHYCDRTFSGDHFLNLHCQSQHKDSDGMFPCKHCSRCEIFGFFSSPSLKTREKYISFAQFVYFLREVCLLFNF